MDACLLCQRQLGAGWYHCNPAEGQRGDHGITPKERGMVGGGVGADRLR